MSSGWGCQYLSKFEDEKDWCRLLKHKCTPNCNGCVLYGRFLFSDSNIALSGDLEGRKEKKREDNPLG